LETLLALFIDDSKVERELAKLLHAYLVINRTSPFLFTNGTAIHIFC
jgi:hypothetical protein